MAKSIKLENETYWDSSSITDDETTLNTIIDTINSNIATNKTNIATNTSNISSLTSSKGKISLTKLTGDVYLNTGTITLSDSIANYPLILVTTGNVSGGTYYTALCAPFITRSTWQTNDAEYLNGPTANGSFSLKITNSTTLTIESTSDRIRGIIGIQLI